jgi:hypothetical protein
LPLIRADKIEDLKDKSSPEFGGLHLHISALSPFFGISSRECFCVKSGLTGLNFAPYMIDHVIHHTGCVIAPLFPPTNTTIPLNHESSMATA